MAVGFQAVQVKAYIECSKARLEGEGLGEEVETPQSKPLQPELQAQTPVEVLQVPWLKQLLGQLNTIYELQSVPYQPELQVQTPVLVLQVPCDEQPLGQGIGLELEEFEGEEPL